MTFNAPGGRSGPARLPALEPLRPPSSMNSPLTFQPSSLPALGLHGPGPSRQRQTATPLELQGNLGRHMRKTSFDHTISRSNIFPSLAGHSRVGSDELADPLDPILVRSINRFRLIFLIHSMSGEKAC